MADELRPPGIDVLGRYRWGAHICLFYDSKEDLFDIHAAYFQAGLLGNEFCLWAISDPSTVEEAHNGLSQRIDGFDEHLAAGRIEILPGRNWYLDDGVFDLKRVTDAWDNRLGAAIANGYDGMRVSGNSFWLGTEQWGQFLDYEQELEHSLAGKRMLALCTYPLHASKASDVLCVTRRHDVTVVRRGGNWEFVQASLVNDKAGPLTPRELEVLTWVARGKSAWEIGEILSISKRMVDEHAQQATQKLCASNRTQAVAIALCKRIIDPGTF
jgi:DNA-binding CsgD family transcriptional regulator